MGKYFKAIENPYNPTKFILCPVYEKFSIGIVKGSYNLLPARLLNLTWANYLRLCRDEYGATLIGKNHLYPTINFDKEPKELIKVLDKRTEEIFKWIEKRKI